MATPIKIEGANETAVKTSVSRPSKISGGMRVKEFLYLCLENWLWFVISIAVCLACAYV